jgi:hypothetical protein
MTNDSTQQLPSISLGKRMLIGAIIGLVVISYFLILSHGGDPAWGKYWMIRPLIVTPFAGAMGGLCNYVIIRYHQHYRIPKILAYIATALVFIVGLWMGIILGLDGTMWN